jgi:hypothetical protein
MFTSVTWFADLEAVRDFAGDDYEQAVVEDAARAALSRWDETGPSPRSGCPGAVAGRSPTAQAGREGTSDPPTPQTAAPIGQV